MPYNPTAWVNNTAPPINATNLNHIEAGIQTAQAAVEAVPTKQGKLFVDDYGRDDAALDTLLSTAGADTHPRGIYWSNRGDGYDYATVNRIPPRGCKFYGPPGFSNPEVNSQQKMNCRINLTGAGPWFNTGASDNWDNTFADLTLVCNAGSSFLGRTGAGTWRGLKFGNLAQKSGNGLIGSFANALNGTVITAFGHIWVNGNTDTAIHVAGSDMHLLWSSCFVDSAPANAPAGGHPHVMFDFADFCTVGPMYITAEGNWGAVDFLGTSNPLTSTSNNSGRVTCFGLTATGRNPGQPCNGATVRVKGGIVKLVGGEIAWGMANPGLMGRSPTDAGVVHQSGGVLQMDGFRYDRTTGQAETVPFVYSSAGRCIVKNTVHTSRGGTWTGLPRVDEAGGSMDLDAYVTQI
jgi:hypothetical protein